MTSAPHAAQPWPRPASLACAYSVLDQHGAELALRLPDPGEVLCEECVGALVHGVAPDPAACCDQQWHHPIWMIRDPSCPVAGQGMLAHLSLSGTECRCGIVELYDVLDQLAPQQRQPAVDAHVRHIRSTYAHLLAAESCNDGVGLDVHLASACTLCISDPSHVEDLDAALSYATAQLALVLQAFEANLNVGERRAPAGALGA